MIRRGGNKLFVPEYSGNPFFSDQVNIGTPQTGRGDGWISDGALNGNDALYRAMDKIGYIPWCFLDKIGRIGVSTCGKVRGRLLLE